MLCVRWRINHEGRLQEDGSPFCKPRCLKPDNRWVRMEWTKDIRQCYVQHERDCETSALTVESKCINDACRGQAGQGSGGVSAKHRLIFVRNTVLSLFDVFAYVEYEMVSCDVKQRSTCCHFSLYCNGRRHYWCLNLMGEKSANAPTRADRFLKLVCPCFALTIRWLYSSIHCRCFTGPEFGRCWHTAVL